MSASTPGRTPLELPVAPEHGITWFSVDPREPTLALYSVHREWNQHTLVQVERSAEGWSGGEPVPFSGLHPDRAGRFQPDGDYLFSSRRPGAGGDWDLWRVRREGATWGPPIPLPAPVNSEHRDYHGSVTRDGVVYFISTRPSSLGEGDVYRAVPGADGYRIEQLPAGINTELWEVDVYVAPDESYLVFARSDDPSGPGSDDLFVVTRDGEGWSTPRPLPLNTAGYEFGAFVSADGATLYFTGGEAGHYRPYQVPAVAVGLPARKPGN